MAEESSSEKTEEPTSRRLEKAREEGQIARSPDLSTAVVLVTATLIFTFAGHWMFLKMGQLFVSQLEFDRKILDKSELLPAHLGQSLFDGDLSVHDCLGCVGHLVHRFDWGIHFFCKIVGPQFRQAQPHVRVGQNFWYESFD